MTWYYLQFFVCITSFPPNIQWLPPSAFSNYSRLPSFLSPRLSARVFLHRRHQQHHGPAQLISHPWKIHHVLWRLGLHHPQNPEAASRQRVQIGGEGAVVLHHPLPQKDRLPAALPGVIVHREVEDFAVRAIVPVLRTIGGKYRVLHGEHEAASRCQPAADAPHHQMDIGRTLIVSKAALP